MHRGRRPTRSSGDALQAPTESSDGSCAEPNFGDSSPADWIGEGGGTSVSRDDRNDDEPSYAEIQAAVTSLRDHLGWQLAMMPLSERDRSLVRLLIEALDDDGYLAQNLEELVEMLPAELEVDTRRAADRPEASAELRSARHRRTQRLGVPGTATGQSARVEDVRSGPENRAQPPRPAGCPRLRQIAQGGRLQRGRAARGPGADPLAQSPSRRAVFAGGNPLCHCRRDRAQGPRPMDCLAQCRGDATPAHQPPLRGHPAGPARLGPRQPAAGSQMADQERAAAFRDDPARIAGHRGPAAPVLRSWRCGDAAAHPARDRRPARPARIDHLARDHAEVHGHPARRLRVEVFLRQPRRHRGRRRGLLHRHPRADQAAGRRRRRQETPLRCPARRNSRPAGHRGGTTHRRQVPRSTEHSRRST